MLPVEAMQTSGGADWNSLISLLVWLVFLLYFFTDLPQKAQFARYERGVAARLATLESMVKEGIVKVKSYLAKIGVENGEGVVRSVLDNYFAIEPVSLEPTDIIRRLDHVITVNEDKFKRDLERELPGIGRHMLNNIAVTLAIVSALHTIFKVLRHYYLLGKKYENWVLLMQLYLVLPQIIKELVPYLRAIDGFARGIPVGDSAGPLVAFRLAGLAPRIDIAEDTVYSIVEIEGRKVYVVKAKGPGATVGKPGKAVAKLVEMLSCKVSRIITVDAALKLEGEQSGTVAEGSGAAIGDPGPEKIEIERSAVKCGAPLDAVIIKMGADEAIKPMSKEIAGGVERAYQKVIEIIRSRTKPGDVVIVAGIGNSVGVY